MSQSTGESADFTLPDAKGQLHSLSAFRGSWVIVNFWASWCSPCLKEIPDLARIQRHYPDSLRVIGINFEELNREELQAAVDQLKIPYLVVQAGDHPLIPFEPIQGLPSTFFVDPEGRIVTRHAGPLSFIVLGRLLRQFGLTPG